MRQRLLDIHLYAGLLCAPYLVVYGLSTLSFNHGEVLGPIAEETAWERAVTIPPLSDDRSLALALRDSLGLIGAVPSWEVRREPEGTLRFIVNRPAKRYRAEVDSNGVVRVAETKRGIWGALRGLHGLTNIPGSPLGPVWGFYTEISIFALVFSVGTGLYFWLTSPSSRRVGLWSLGAGTAMSAALIVYFIL